jgi:CheY-like chemotaxis protein
MVRHVLRFGVGVCLLVTLTAHVSADDPPKKEAPAAVPAAAPAPTPAAPAPAADANTSRPGDEYRQFFKKPETTEDYWTALRYEIEVGRYDLAAGLLHALLAKPPTEAELLQIHEKYGMSAILALRQVPKWSDDPATEKQGRADAGQLIDLVREAVKKKLNDPERIKGYVSGLNGDREEHDFALKELYRSGGQVVPYLIDELQSAPPEQRLMLLDALRRLGPDTLPPLYAVLDSNIPTLQLDILEVLRKRAAVNAVPYLWRLTAGGQPEAVRQKATLLLAEFLDVPPSKLPLAKIALTQLADRYYQHKVLFADPKAVTIWRWDEATKKLVRGWPGAEAVTKDKAEEYYGTRFAKEALALDPSYAPAQRVLLSLALEKGAVLAGGPPGKETPAVKDLLSTVNPDLITTVLERALDDHRPEVILPAVKALGDVDDVRANRPGNHGEPALVRALNYPNRRMQMAAADALMRIPGEPGPLTGGRIVEVWRRALATAPASPAPKVIVGYHSEAIGNHVADTVKKSGFDPIQVRTGYDVLKRLNEAADVDLVLIDEALPDPGLPSLLAQLRADVNYGRVPVVVTATKEREDAMRRYVEHSLNVSVLPLTLAESVPDLKSFLQVRLDEGGPPLSEAELKEYAEKAVHRLADLAKGQPPGVDVRPTAETVYTALRSGGLSPEGQIDAIHIVGRFAGSRPQTELADVVLDERRTPKVRAAATAELIRNVQEHSLNLSSVQIESLATLYAKGGDPDLKAELALLMGGMRPDARLTGQRLLNYRPPTPGVAPAPAAPPKEPPPAKEPPKEK